MNKLFRASAFRVRAALVYCALFGVVACGGGGSGGTPENPVVVPPPTIEPSPVTPPVSEPPPVTPPPVVATAGISLTAGAAWGPGSLDGVGRSAYFNWYPGGIATDASGTLYVADTGNCTIRKLSGDGTVTTLAGRSRVCAMQDGKGTDGLFRRPGDIAVVPDGTVYVMDSGKLRRVTQQGEVTTIDITTDGTVLDTIAAGPDGALYLANSFIGAAVYRLVPGSSIALLAGQSRVPGTADGLGTKAQFSDITDLAVDSSSNVYVSQRAQHTIRKIAPDGTVTTFAGVAGQMGSRDGTGAAALLSMPGSLAVDPQGFLWFADFGSSMFRRISPTGEVTSPFRNSAPLLTTGGQLAYGASGYLHFTMALGVGRITAAGVISSLAGQDFAEGTPIQNVQRLVVDAAGNPVVTSPRGGIQKFGPNGEVLPVGSGESLLGDAAGNHYYASLTQTNNFDIYGNVGGSLNEVAPTGEVTQLVNWVANSSNAMAPAYMTVAADGTLYFIDVIKGNLVQWTAAAGIKVLANVGAAEPFYSFSPRNPRSLAVDTAGRVYVLSTTALERYDNGVVTAVAGVKGQPGTSDGVGSEARFTSAVAIVADAARNLYVADGELIRKVTPAGVVTTVVGQVGHVGLRTGPLPGNVGIITQLAIGPDGVLHATADNALVRVRLQ